MTLSLQSTLSLECWIVGESLTNRFLVDIGSDKRVQHLQQAIKEEEDNGLGDIRAKNIMLWKVRITIVTVRTLPTCKGFHTDERPPLARGEYSRGNEQSRSTCLHREAIIRLPYTSSRRPPSHRCLVKQIDSYLLDYRRRDQTRLHCNHQ
jgi:hypothetical protein